MPAEADTVFETEEFLTRRTEKGRYFILYQGKIFNMREKSSKRLWKNSQVSGLYSWEKLEQVFSEKCYQSIFLELSEGHPPSGSQKDHTQLGAVT